MLFLEHFIQFFEVCLEILGAAQTPTLSFINIIIFIIIVVLQILSEAMLRQAIITYTLHFLALNEYLSTLKNKQPNNQKCAKNFDLALNIKIRIDDASGVSRKGTHCSQVLVCKAEEEKEQQIKIPNHPFAVP